MKQRDRPLTPDEALRNAHGLVDRITSFVSFSVISGYALDFGRVRDGIDLQALSFTTLSLLAGNLQLFVKEKTWPLLLAVVTLIWLLRYKAASRNEIGIIVSCFSSTIPLPEWKTLHGSRITRLLARGLIIIFLLLAGLVAHIELYAITIYVWAIADLLGNSSIQKNLMSLFQNPRYLPPNDDPLRELILRRRAVAFDYWVERPQLVRITIFITAISATVLMLGSSGLAPNFPYKSEIAYSVLMIAILANTTTMGVWRRARDAVLHEIDGDTNELLQARTRQ